MPRNFMDEILDDVPKYTLRNSEGDVLNDNVDISLKTPVIQEGTPLNKKFFDGLFTYEEMTVERIDNSEQITSNVFGQIPRTLNSKYTVVHGTAIGNKDWLQIPFTMETNYAMGISDDSPTANLPITMYCSYASSGSTDEDEINANFTRTTYDSSYYNIFKGRGSNVESIINLVWDLGRNRDATLRYRIYGNGFERKLYVSDDNINWTEKSVLVAGSNSNISCGNHRYIKVTFTLNNSNVPYVYIYYMYLTVSDLIPNVENAFTSNDSITENKEIIVRTPDNLDTLWIVKNTINGIDVDKLLNPGERIKLLYDGEKLTRSGRNVVTGSVTGIKNTLVQVNVGFKPDLVIIYSENNNGTGVGSTSGNGSAYAYHVPRVLTDAHSNVETGCITETGFTFKSAADNDAGYYIAIKF